MTIILPVTTPQFLTDDIFVQYGFFTGTSTPFQRQAAYAIAENQVALDIGTFITPTIFTGTFPFVRPNQIIESPVGRIIQIKAVTLFEKWDTGIDRLVSGTSRIIDQENGYFMIDTSPYDVSQCNDCSGGPMGIYKADVVIEAGYGTGTASIPTVGLALCMAADISMKIMYDFGALPSGDDYTKTFQSGRFLQSISDKFQYETAFGKSNYANFIRKMIDPFRIVRAGKL